MATKADVTKFYTTEALRKANHYYGSSYETYAEAEQAARTSAWNCGEAYLVMAPISMVEAPAEINTTKVSKL